MPQLVIVADDLTGAADTGSCFAAAGYSTVIPLMAGLGPEADVVVLSTETRDLDAAAASEIVARTVREQFSGPSGAAPRWIYKKIDSALRGHPRNELLATMTAAGIRRALVAPAFPAEGRTTICGQQHVAGVSLAASRFGGPGAVSSLSALFANDRGIPVRSLGLPALRSGRAAIREFLAGGSPGIVVADAETDSDLAALAAAASQMQGLVLCGAAGFAQQLAPVLPLVPAASAPTGRQSAGGPALIVAGSQHDATARQIAALRENGVPVVRLDQAMIDDPAAPVDQVVSVVAAHLAAGRSTVVTTAGLARAQMGGRAIAARLAEIAAAPTIAGNFGGLVLTGGDVATAVCAGLGAEAIWLRGDVVPGVPWGTLAGGVRPGIPIVTKAGSFGGEGVLVRSLAHLSAPADGTPAAG